MPDARIVTLPFPRGGLDENFSFTDQPGETSPSLSNVVPYDPASGRNRGGQRPGLAKRVSDQIYAPGTVPASIQDIVHTTGPNFNTASGPGQMVVAEPDDTAWGLIDADGTRYATGGGSAEIYLMSCFDDEGNVYIATRKVSGGVLVYLTKLDIGGVQQWQQSVNTGYSGPNNPVAGMVVHGPRLFVLFDATGDYNDSIWRFAASTGAAIDGVKWASKAGATLSGGAFIQTPSWNHLSSSGAYIGAILGNGVAGDWSVYLDVLNPETGEQISATELVNITGAGCNIYGWGIEGNGTGRFFVCYQTFDGGSTYTSYLDQRLSDGTLAPTSWQITSAASQDDHPDSIAYDSTNDRIACVGADVMGTGSSFVVYDGGTDKSQDHASDPDSVTDWQGVYADSGGGFRLTRNSTGNNVIALTPSLTLVSWQYDADADDQSVALAINTVNAINPAAFKSRASRLLVTAGGTVRRIDTGSVTAVTSGINALDPSPPVIFSASYFPDIYFADGMHKKYFKSSTNTMTAWTPTAGSFPVDSDGRYPTLICAWAARIVQAGLKGDPHGWFMTAVGDPFDFDYSPASSSASQAVAGVSADAAELQDMITALMPYDNDYLLFGMDHSLAQMTGNPAGGGRFDVLSDVTGVAWGRAFAQTPDRAIWFVGSRGGLYRIEPNQRIPQRIAETTIDERLSSLDMGDNVVRLVWDDRLQGLLMTVTPVDITSATTHYWFDMRNKSFFPWSFGNTNHNPKAIHLFDGDDPDDRVILLGSWDGYVRYIDYDGTSDDGTAIDSYVFIGPIQNEDLVPLIMNSLSAVLDDSANDVSYSIHVGESAESALAAPASVSGTFSAGRNNYCRRRVSGHSIFVKLRNNTDSETWSLERIQAAVAPTSVSYQRRGY